MRTLVVSDDPTELNYIKALFNKLGMQIETVVRPNLMAQSLLGFNPELLLISTRSSKFNSVDVALDLKKKRPNNKVVMIKSPDFKVDDRVEGLDGFLDTPISPNSLITLLEKFGQKNTDVLREKLQKISQAKTEAKNNSESQVVRGGTTSGHKQTIKGSATQQETTIIKGHRDGRKSVEMPGKTDREGSYGAYVKGLDPIDDKQHYPEDQIRDFNKKLRKEKVTSEEESIIEQKKSFVEALFTEDE